MTDNTIFADKATETPVTQENATTSSPTPTLSIPTEATEFIGEGKKYKSVEEALKSVAPAQKHISTLEAELAQAREELTKRRTAEELLNEIKNTSSNPTTVQTNTSVEADPEVLSQIVEQILDKKTAQATAQSNAKTVIDKFTVAFGEKAEQKFLDIANATGMSVQMLNQLSMQSPSAVLKLAGLDISNTPKTGGIKSDVSTPPASTNNTDFKTVIPKYATTRDLNHAYAEAVRKVQAQHNNNKT